MLGCGFLNGQGGIQAVGHGQQALGKTFDAELAGLGDFVFSAAPRVLGLSLRAQELVGQIGAFGLELGQLALQARQLVGGVGSHGGFYFFGGGGILGCGGLALI
ncbi:hypothetical protein D3C87_1698450 [compost metagenome]